MGTGGDAKDWLIGHLPWITNWSQTQTRCPEKKWKLEEEKHKATAEETKKLRYGRFMKEIQFTTQLVNVMMVLKGMFGLVV